jgi:hypothetical protein
MRKTAHQITAYPRDNGSLPYLALGVERLKLLVFKLSMTGSFDKTEIPDLVEDIVSAN